MATMRTMANEFIETILLTAYYKNAFIYKTFLKNDNTPDIFRSENELVLKEFKKRYWAVFEKMYDCSKVQNIDKYIAWDTPVSTNSETYFKYFFDFSKYANSVNINTPLYTPTVITKVDITKEKKLFRTIEHKTETKHLEVGFSKEVIEFGELLEKLFNKLPAIKNFRYLDFEVCFRVC